MHPLLRFTLDLFGSNQPVAPVNQAPTATKKVATKQPVATPPKSRVFAPTANSNCAAPGFLNNFRHPQANREILLGEVQVAFEFKRGQRRSIGFSVGPHGLAVRAPKWTLMHQVDAALLDKAKWILRKLHESRQRHASLNEQAIDWSDGVAFLFLGRFVTLRIDPLMRQGAAGAQFVNDNASETLRIGLPYSATADQMGDVVQAWMMRQAKQLFLERLDHFAPMLGVQWKKLGLSNAATRWGSAKSDGSIRLNWRLMQYPMSVIDYVVAHELSHLREMNHSPRFWDTVRSVVPDYAALRQQLKDQCHSNQFGPTNANAGMDRVALIEPSSSVP
jgi:predicted metal-dependent hydrolase